MSRVRLVFLGLMVWLPFVAKSQVAANPQSQSEPRSLQAIQPQDRVTEPISNALLVPLAGHVHPKARSENDAGPVSANFKMLQMTLGLRRDPNQQAAMDAFAAAQQTPGSP